LTKHPEYKRSVLLFILICSGIAINAQKLSVDNSDFFYQISPVFGFKQSIVSLTFDDGYKSQFRIGAKALKKRNLQATFYVITKNIDIESKGLMLETSSQAYEIGSHTVTHPDLSLIGASADYQELFDSKSFLQKNFGLNSGLTLSYPYGKYNNSIKQEAANLYLAARSTDDGFNSINLLDRFALKIKRMDQKTQVSDANQWVDNAINNHLWLVEMIHGINNGGYLSVDSATFVDHLDHIKDVEDQIWCSSVSNVIKYLDEAKSTQIKCEFCNDTIYKISKFRSG
jgi:peptidoglycan/xylan/chitin deacetylase (PgdA/CDA1 family)